MQYMCIVKATPQSEAGEMPSLELIEAMGQWIGGLKPGVFVSGGGLQPSAEGFRVNLSGGKVTVTDGPFTETHLGVLLDETRVLARLVDDLRTVTLAEAGTLALHREQTDVGILVTEVAEAFGPQAQAAGVRVLVEAADDLPLIDVDPVRIREVIENLLSNALRYAPAGSAVRLDARLADGRVVFVVGDEGPGIAPELLPHVFDRFVKADGSPGSGLGLAIAKGIVEAHGGRIVAESDATGTRIRFDLAASSG